MSDGESNAAVSASAFTALTKASEIGRIMLPLLPPHTAKSQSGEIAGPSAQTHETNRAWSVLILDLWHGLLQFSKKSMRFINPWFINSLSMFEWKDTCLCHSFLDSIVNLVVVKQNPAARQPSSFCAEVRSKVQVAWVWCSHVARQHPAVTIKSYPLVNDVNIYITMV